nr:helix-turn-helix domain-containing protein [Cohnella sp. CFH 77786]
MVDDEPLVLEGLKFMVDWQGHGFRVCGEACDGEEALERIAELDPDLVVTDIRMPILDGLQLLERCAADPRVRSRFVILSGHEEFSFAHQALRYGVVNYWLKPIDTDEIHETLRKLREQWSEERCQPPVTLPQPNPSPQPEREFPVTGISEELCAAEDGLFLAIESGEGERIVQGAELLATIVRRSFADPAWRKSYLTHFLLELAWKTSAGETGEEMTITGFEAAQELPFFPTDEEAWERQLADLCREAADRLAAQRAKAGPAGEAARYVRRRYHEPLKLQDVAKALHFQPAYLGQLFKKHIGMSFLDYVHRTRIEEARKLLRRTDLKIADIARAVGYADPELFTAKFRQFMNVSPSQYKKS